jgi:SNF2 family DNA or RNA helicase
LNLQDGGHHIVFFTPTWDLELYAQVIERIGPVRQAQSGYTREVFVYHILARDTVDPVVKVRRENKGSLMDLFMDRLRSDGHPVA